MQENELGDEGFTALGNALAVNTTLQQVALGGNNRLPMMAFGRADSARTDITRENQHMAFAS